MTSSPHLREKKDIIDGFIQTVKPNTDIDIFDEWQKFIAEKREEELADIINAEKLKEGNAREFMNKALRDGYVEESGMEITKVLPPMPVFGAGKLREQKKKSVIDKFKHYIERFKDL